MYKRIFHLFGKYSHPFDNDVILTRVAMAFHEGDHKEIPPKHAMEDAD